MNIRQYLDNPMGKGAIIPGKQAIIEDLNKRYNELIKEKKIENTIYQDGNDYIFHLIIPSESERDNTYDVVVQFSPVDKTSKGDESILEYDLKFFSNCPSFIFTYAYAYSLNGSFIDYLDVKLEKEVFKSPPVVKNPNNMVNFEKSIYFACKFIYEEKKFLSKNYLKTSCQKFKKKDFIYKIRTQEQIMMEIKKAKNKIKEYKQKEEKINKKAKVTKNIMDRTNSPNSINVIKPKKSITGKNSNSGVQKVTKTNAKKSIVSKNGKSSVGKINKIKGKKR